MTVTVKTSTNRVYTFRFVKNGVTRLSGRTVTMRTGCFSPDGYPLKKALYRIDQWLAGTRGAGTRISPRDSH